MSAASRVWLFDLDNTLHDANPRVFPWINRAMTDYLMEHLALDEAEADALRMSYWQRYGATLLGMIRHHGTDPAHFLKATHDFPDLRSLLVFKRALPPLLRRLPGRKYLFSNGPQAYANAVLAHIGARRNFAAVFGIEALGLQPKPQPRAFSAVLRALKLPAQRCILVEDSLENLRMARALGMKTVWISSAPGKPACVDVKLGSILEIGRAAWLAR
ncbi:pyrimidine 5'-nucleotidase [Niveibacterium terrae]|uniref:pyrimidine 5'-nucleotidase n=1 Tax=Niveibacterium terrae TaxID=3373598 RepID=UPI003A8F33E0